MSLVDTICGILSIHGAVYFSGGFVSSGIFWGIIMNYELCIMHYALCIVHWHRSPTHSVGTQFIASELYAVACDRFLILSDRRSQMLHRGAMQRFVGDGPVRPAFRIPVGMGPMPKRSHLSEMRI